VPRRKARSELRAMRLGRHAVSWQGEVMSDRTEAG